MQNEREQKVIQTAQLYNTRKNAATKTLLDYVKSIRV